MAKLITPSESLVLSNQIYTQQWNALPESEANFPIMYDLHGKINVATVSAVRCDGQYYLVTANHCIEAEKKQTIQLDTDLNVDVTVNDWIHIEDFDIAFMRLAGDLKDYIVGCEKYLEVPSCKTFVKLRNEPRHFFMVGFPASKNKQIRYNKKVIRYITYLKEDVDHLSGDAIFCSFDKKNYFDACGNKIQNHHSPIGNSGGPLIYVNSFSDALDGKDANFTFSGVLIESSGPKNNLLKFASAILLRNIFKLAS